VLLDEPWLQGLLSQQASPRVDIAGEQTRSADRVSAPQASGEPRVDWGEALNVPSFYGREEELALLSRWVVEVLSCSGICTVASICAPCCETAPTSAWISAG